MPVLKIFYEESLDVRVQAGRADIQAGLERMMRETLKADPDKCQIVMCTAKHMSPKPVYVDMQFRANEYRTPAVVGEAMQQVAEVLSKAIGAGIRIRAFDIDQSTLHAFEAEGQEQQ